MSLLELAIPLIVDVLLLVVTPIPWPKIIVIISCDVCLCIKCLVLWRFVGCAPQKKDAGESSNPENDEQNSCQANALELISVQKLQFAAIETLIDQPQQGLVTETEISKKKPS
jgi:hypothetical protein